MKMRKYSFTLMEVMIGFAIISLVLGMIFSSLYQETLLKTKIDKMERVVMTHVELQQSLDRIFANLIPISPQNTKRTLYSSEDTSPKLCISFDNGIDPDPLFCDEVEGTLLIEKGNFILRLSDGKPYERTIILKEKVNDLSFEFLTNSIVGLESLSYWDKSINYPPSFVKITLNRNEDYVFWINQTTEGIPLRGRK
ncbi:MAG: type II secretion system protein [Simkaniaceae bacterium]|jgi:hypothetical protein|nr:MAG: type II secretion system protein [Simkaniaceae bacterium]